MTDFKNVLLSEIRPDPNQPRKFYDELAMQELTDSVREKGILQPILIRPNGKGYILVCGERRYRAATAVQALHKDRKEIPAVIRELSDEEALELQIIENLQRKDVHPMEEAVAFKSLAGNGMAIEEIASKVAKSVFYVRQRIKLSSLTKPWQEIYFHNLVENKIALELSQFTEKDQESLYKLSVRKNGKELSVNISDWNLRNFTGQLNGATFDKKDITLNPEMGACTVCQHNTAVSSLFPEDAKNPLCKKIDCFKHKTTVQFERTLEELKNDPTITFVSDNYTNTGDKRILAIQKTHKVLFTKDYSRTGSYEGYATRSGMEAAKITGASKGFYVEGSYKGMFCWIRIAKGKTSATSGKTKEKIASGKASAADIDAEISRINDREKRSKELDAEKQWAEIKKLLDLDDQIELFKNVPFTTTAFSQEEKNAIAVALIEELGYPDSEMATEVLKVKNNDLDIEVINKLKVSDDQLFHLLRIFAFSILKKNGISPVQSEGPAALLPLLKSKNYIPEKIAEIEASFAEKIAKRQANVKKRIDELNAQKKKLVPAKPKAAAKKSSSKKASKK